MTPASISRRLLRHHWQATSQAPRRYDINLIPIPSASAKFRHPPTSCQRRQRTRNPYDGYGKFAVPLLKVHGTYGKAWIFRPTFDDLVSS